MTVDLILFDLDGTLADTAPDLALALDALRPAGQPPVDRIQVRAATALGTAALLRTGLGMEAGMPGYEAARLAFLAHYERIIGQATELTPGMVAVLDRLAQAGLCWGVVTNKPERLAHRVLTMLGLADRARCIVGGDSVARCKPHPDPLLRACELLDTAPGRALYVGDDLGDVQAAHAAGMPALAAAFGYTTESEARSWGAEGLLRTPADLLPFVL